ncbi:PHP domain-containing protein [uncultured Paludibaculum sp.]|uniref:PHP domain-containing protein n=1 Tax=uncultured Paludibaculum sp. TaxID=1765020 RepID=UPI002AAB9F6C|nr:PHP domain-containing protein [uncultured Paludibaculum sp.]
MIDLHTHTDRSDGSTAPEDLVRQAVAEGLQALGIADHDTLAGYEAAGPAAAACGLELICAVELSTRPNECRQPGKRERSVHVLGYWLLEPPTTEFRCWLETQQASRRRRNVDLLTKLRELGVSITLEDAEVYGRNQVGRPHIARVLCDKGYVSTIQEAFDVYLADEAKAAVERDEPTLEEGIRLIQESGGMSSLAHPVRLPQRGADLFRLVQRLVEAGLQGIEVHHSEHSPADCAEYAEIARRFDLIPTGGSDFHGDNKPGIRLGHGINGNAMLPYSFLEQMWEQCTVKRH